MTVTAKAANTTIPEKTTTLNSFVHDLSGVSIMRHCPPRNEAGKALKLNGKTQLVWDQA
jgi:hypothetical protein